MEEEEEEGARDAMEALKGGGQGSLASLPPEITKDAEIMKFAVKGTDKDWAEALGADGKGGVVSGSNIQIKTTAKGAGETTPGGGKRKLNDADIAREAERDGSLKKKKRDKKSKKTKRRKSND
uniref:Uncharacterized protein n=1 Tax=Trieres chinensis TaxID=1514140 RepID=A0A7S1ZFH9_TRICV